MSKPVADRAEVSIDFPDKLYVGSFERDSRLDVSADERGLHIKIERGKGEKRRFGFHLHYYLLAELIESIGEALADYPALEPQHKDSLQQASKVLAKSVKG